MNDVMHRVLALEAQLQTVRKQLLDVESGGLREAAYRTAVPDYSNYIGPFMVGCRGGGSVYAAPGHIIGETNTYAWTGGTGSLTGTGTVYVTLNISLDGTGAVTSAAVGCYTSLASIVNTESTRRVLLAVVTRSPYGCYQQQRGNIVLSGGRIPVLDIVVTDAALDYSSLVAMPVGLDGAATATINQRYIHAATYEVNTTAGATRNTIKFLNPKAMYELTFSGCFRKTSGTADGDTEYPILHWKKGTALLNDPPHALMYRMATFQEVVGTTGTANTFRENFSLTTLLVPEDDLSSDTMSLWGGAGKGYADYEIVIKQVGGLYDD